MARSLDRFALTLNSFLQVDAEGEPASRRLFFRLIATKAAAPPQTTEQRDMPA